MSSPAVTNPLSKVHKIRFIAYVSGFVVSILLTLMAFHIVDDRTLTGWSLTLTLIGFAILQLWGQLLFFLHLDSESKPRWNLMVFIFMAIVLVIVVVGSLWIMNNLNYHMNPEETDRYLLEEERLQR